MTFIPKPPLANAVRKALKTFAKHFPTRGFKLANETSEDANEFIADYARALVGVTLDAIPDAAQRWVATRKEFPSPATFGVFARALDVAEYRPPVAVPSYNRGLQDGILQNTKNVARIDELYYRARKTLTHAEIVQVWALIWKAAATDEQRIACRRGDVPDDIWDDAVRIVRDSRPKHATVPA